MTITPEKLRELADVNVSGSVIANTWAYFYRKALRDAADEIERLQEHLAAAELALVQDAESAAMIDAILQEKA